MKYFSLFTGIGGFDLPLKEMGFECIGWSEVDKWAIRTFEVNFPELAGKNYGDVTKINCNELPDFNLLVGGSPCFAGDTLVMTSKGYLPIGEIKVGDYVLTHTNSFQRVVKIMSRFSANIYKVKTYGSENVLVTKDHPFYVREKSQLNYENGKAISKRMFSPPYWETIENMDKTYYIGIAVNQKSEIPKWGGIQKVINQFVIESQKTLPLDTSDFWWIVGRYMGDGWLRITKRKKRKNSYMYQIVICCAKKEARFLKEKLSKCFTISATAEERTVIKLTITNQELCFYLKQFGRGAKNKRITSDIFNLPEELLRSFLMGYFSADGCFNEKIEKWQATTISRELAYGLQACIHKAYKRPCSITYFKRAEKCCIEGRVVNQSDTYILRFREFYKKQDQPFYENGYIWVPFRTKEMISFNREVYNLEVEKDNSYTAFNLIVHNCQDFSISKNNRTGLKGKRSGLFEEYLRILKEKQPDNFIWENVKGVLSCNQGEDWKYIYTSFQEAGYKIKYQVLNTKDYEIPQNRERVFVVGQREDLGKFDFEFPGKRKLKIFLKDIIEDGYVDKEISHCIKKNFACTSESDLSDYLKESRGQIVFVDRDVSYCIDANHHKGSSLELYKNHLRRVVFNRPVQIGKVGNGGQGAKTGLYQFGDKFRKLTPLECFRLQGFPDEFYHRAKGIGISNTQLYRQAGNAVTVNVVRAILESLYLDNTEEKQLSLF